ncbi:MAG: acetyl-CoA carboxylase biotin carboxyl carrier protein subunit [Veillonellaceae bacterium]|nr:acetyl-CoA carboxylase biotin carboxyl carrier protein subunit [Veillonellaceae bacterium]
MKKFIITYKGQKYELEVEEVTGNSPVQKAAAAAPVPAPTSAPKQSQPAVSTGEGAVKAPMPGKILDILVKPGDSVKQGATMLILEAMKMKNEIVAPHDAKISEVRVASGATVSTGDVLLILG